ncbi:hypothetical protein BC827DRAFT_1191871 [Russula dissimulans]|nr:hypothetical protein BC827DRAFT_1191871 [Russula dissimulans]
MASHLAHGPSSTGTGGNDDTAASGRQGAEADLLHVALHHAFQSHSSTHGNHAERQDSVPVSRRDDRQNGIEIIVNTDVLVLRGTGVDVEPALLSGHVVLNLTESTTVKQITLQFRGKAKLPPLENELVSFSNPPMTYIVWEKRRSHTLKAGRHLFPFQLNVGGSLPSTVYTSAYRGASVAYKLRAVATRPGFAHNLQAQKVITLLRSFTSGALEYQQSLEIENTWPEKVMYSIMVPHKAWAAGDDLTAVLKISPLAKGVRILSVATTLNETVKVLGRLGWQESTKPVISTGHEFRNGQAVWVEHHDHRTGTRSSSSHQPQRSRTPSLGHSLSLLHTSNPGPSSEPQSSHSSEAGPSASAQSPLPNTEPRGETHSTPTGFELSEGDINTKLEISLPLSATPTHSLEPIIASHRIRWHILIDNPDGSKSELRCSLPLHILDCRLLDEAKSATALTRRLLLGGSEGSLSEEDSSDVDQLPSYPSHIRDRIANMYLPDQAVMRVTNPWIHQGISPVQPDVDHDGRHSEVTSGAHTPIEAYLYVNSELLLSLSQHAPSPIESHRGHNNAETSPLSRTASRRGASQPPSRMQSRAPSPDRDSNEPSRPHSRSHSRRSSGSGSGSDGAPSTYLHSNSTASRNVHGLFHTTMKPLTSLLASSFILQPRHHTPPSPTSSPSTSTSASISISISTSPTHNNNQRQHQQQHPPAHSGTPAAALARTVPVTSYSLLHRAFTEVPDYDIASRGFLGGVTPLETLQGLPSYEEAEMQQQQQRSRSESDLASMSMSMSMSTTARRGTSSSTSTSPSAPPPLLPLHCPTAPGRSVTATDTSRSS